MSASVEIFTNEAKDVLSVPIQAVTVREDPDAEEKGEGKAEDNNLEVIFTVDSTADTVKMIPVKTGLQDDTYIEVLSGINDGEEIVIGPYSAISRKLKNGSEISTEKAEDKKEGKE